MPNDPKYVRLNDRMSKRTVSDIAGGSRWSISGNDIKPFPKDRNAARYVRRQLAAGILEAASKAELDDLAESNEAYEEQVSAIVADGGHQEDAIRDAAEKAAAERGEGNSDDAGDDADEDDEDDDAD